MDIQFLRLKLAIVKGENWKMFNHAKYVDSPRKDENIERNTNTVLVCATLEELLDWLVEFGYMRTKTEAAEYVLTVWERMKVTINYPG